MSLDLLLEWISERGQGSWTQLRDAWRWLSAQTPAGTWTPTPGFVARQLSMLGHLEMSWDSGRWAAAPPVLTLLPSAGAHALLTGARTRTLLDGLSQETDDAPDLFLVPVTQEHAPTAQLIACEDERAIEQLAARLGIDYTFSVSERLARALPPLDSYLALAHSTPVAAGYGVESFNPRTLAWEAAESDDAPSLYRYDEHGRPEYRLNDEDGVRYRLDLALGVHAALSRWGASPLRYNPHSVNGTLIARVAAPLPTLHARAAALSSGLAPRRFRDGTQRFYNVPRHVAIAIAQTLGHTIRDVDDDTLLPDLARAPYASS